VTVVGTHLSFAPWHAARQLRELVGWAHDLPRPLVLLGDLNLPGGLPARLTGWSLAMRAPTYPAARPRLQFDHVLLDAGARKLRVLDSRSERLAGADHRAARVALTLD
jgi:endonuclease/exonuclease/phosphatase family metal-dependent hydrolase